MFQFIVGSEYMKMACDCLKFGNGDAIAVVFSKQNNNDLICLVDSNGIVQSRSVIMAGVKGEPQPFSCSKLLIEVVNHIYTYDEKMIFKVNSDSGVVVECGKATLPIDVVPQAKMIDIKAEDVADQIECIVDKDEFLHALRIGGLYSDVESEYSNVEYNGTICMSFEEGEDGIKANIFSSINLSFNAYSTFKVKLNHVGDMNDEAVQKMLLEKKVKLLSKKVIVKGSHIAALKNSISGNENNQILISFLPKHVIVSDTKGSYFMTCVNGSFKDQVWPVITSKEYDARIKVNRKAFKSALECAHLGIATEEEDALVLEGTSGKFTIRSHSSRQAVGIDVIERDGSDCMAVFNYFNTLKAINVLSGDEMVLCIKNETSQDYVKSIHYTTNEAEGIMALCVVPSSFADAIKKRQASLVNEKSAKEGKGTLN